MNNNNSFILIHKIIKVYKYAYMYTCTCNNIIHATCTVHVHIQLHVHVPVWIRKCVIIIYECTTSQRK